MRIPGASEECAWHPNQV